MAEQDDLYVGKRAIDEGLCKNEELLECLHDLALERKAREGQTSPRPLGVLLVQRGYLKQGDLKRLLAERLPPGPACARPEPTDLELGKLALACAYATAAQVDECLAIQRSSRKAGEPQPRLGDILVFKGYLTAEQVQRLLAYHQKAIYVCMGCGMRLNVLHARPDGSYRCEKCGASLKPAGPDITSVTETQMELEPVPIPPPSVGGVRPADNQAEIDRAVALYLKQKNMIRRDTLKEAAEFQKEVLCYGIEVPLLEVLRRRKSIGWQQSEQLKRVDFEKLVKSEAWLKQAVPGYKITRKIASGGFAAIFAAERVFGGSRVALKVLLSARAKDPISVKRFRREADLMMKFDHPNIVKAYELEEQGALHFLTMELVEGGSLDRAVREQGAFKPELALRLTRRVAEALFYLQREGYIHRDVKPENVLLDQDGNPKVCDLGFAVGIRDRAQGKSEITLGTAGYVSPEQARGELDLKVGTDIYYLGLTLYFTLTAHEPFQGQSSDRTMSERFSGGVASPDFDRLKAPEPLVGLVRKMLHPERGMRYTTYPELLSALDAVKL